VRDYTHGQSQENLDDARPASVGAAFVTSDQVVLKMVCLPFRALPTH
jgi:hypothetical protein